MPETGMIGLPAAAERLGYSHTTIWRMAAEGTLPTIRARDRYRVSAALIAAALEQAQRGPLVLEEFAAEWMAARQESRDGAA
jgi:excisionase family DNA binding protein